MPISETQQLIFEETKNFLLDRLIQVLHISKDQDSKEAFFFLLGISIAEKNADIKSLTNRFYEGKPYESIRNLFIMISRLAHGTDTDSRYMKAVTDPRFFSNQNTNESEFLCKAFAKYFKSQINTWMHEQEPEDFYKKKYPLLFIKHQDLLFIEPVSPLSPK